MTGAFSSCGEHPGERCRTDQGSYTDASNRRDGEGRSRNRLGPEETPWGPKVTREDSTRWNDYGIGLLRQGDLKGAEYAFQRVTEADPDFADGWLNIARALIQEGQNRSRQAVHPARPCD